MVVPIHLEAAKREPTASGRKQQASIDVSHWMRGVRREAEGKPSHAVPAARGTVNQSTNHRETERKALAYLSRQPKGLAASQPITEKRPKKNLHIVPTARGIISHPANRVTPRHCRHLERPAVSLDVQTLAKLLPPPRQDVGLRGIVHRKGATRNARLMYPLTSTRTGVGGDEDDVLEGVRQEEEREKGEGRLPLWRRWTVTIMERTGLMARVQQAVRYASTRIVGRGNRRGRERRTGRGGEESRKRERERGGGGGEKETEGMT